MKLKISHPFLSKVLSGKALMPSQRLDQFVRFFQLDDFAEAELKKALILDLKRSHKIDNLADGRVEANSAQKRAIEMFREIPIQQMHAFLEKWYHLPILEYLTCESLAKDSVSLAKKLGLSLSEIKTATEKLQKLSLIEMDDTGEWRKTYSHLRLPATNPSQITRQYYQQIFKRMSSELDRTSKTDYDRRLILNFSIATSPGKVKLAKLRLAKFLYDLSVELAEGESSEVYQLTLGFIPITK